MYSKCQQLIDENKTDIPENVYLKLSNLCLEEYKKDDYYKVCYVGQIYKKTGTSDYTITNYRRSEIIKLPSKSAYKIMLIIGLYGTFFKTCKCDNCDTDPVWDALSACDRQDILTVDSQCDDCSEMTVANIYMDTNIIITSVKPMADEE
tara:strand:- start:353 stop:799 length:447 start_codon:yes stop_codon:yes gene_type:complete